MSIEKWNPLKEMEAMRSDMDKIWGELFPTARRAAAGSPKRVLSGEDGAAVPPLDIIDAGDDILVRVEMPGVSKKKIEITVDDNTLTIKGEITKETKHKSENYYHSERTYSSFARSISLPANIIEKKITAGLADGILEIRLPKTDEEKPKKIKVEVK